MAAVPHAPHEPELLTTRAAAQYCGYRTPSALRKAYFDGRLMPVGRRGGVGPLMWRRADLDSFLAGGHRPCSLDIVVVVSPASGKSMRTPVIPGAAGTLLLTGRPRRAEVERARTCELLVVDPFEPRLVSAEFAKLIHGRRRLGKPTIMTTSVPPSAWTAPSKTQERLLAGIARSTFVIEMSCCGLNRRRAHRP